MVQDRGPATSAVTIIMIVLATTFVAARFFTRTFIVKSIKQDDWWMLAAWVIAVGFSTSICVAVRYGLGKHKSDIPGSDYEALRKAEYTLSILYNPSLMLTKTSIVVFYLSVMSKDVDVVFKWCNWITLALVNLAGAGLTLYTVFQCQPVAAGYRYPLPAHAKCTDIVTLYLSTAPVNIITDIAILVLPMPILTGMRLPKKQKIILIVTFSFGAFVAVVDVIRLAYLQSASVTRLKLLQTGSSGTSTSATDNDFSWYASLSFMWSAVEVNLGIICACVPSLKPLFLKFLPSFVRDTGDDSHNHSIDAGKPQMMADPNSVKGNVSMLNHPAAFRKPAVKEYSGEDDGDNMGFLNMLAGPEPDAPESKKSSNRLTRTSTTRSVASDFDFVKMSGSKNMLKLSNRQSVWPISVVTVIFFLWGVAYGLLDTLNSQFEKVAKLNTGQGLGLHAAYFGGYLIGPLTLGRFVLKRYGFKAAMMAGLCVYGCGTLVFWPSAVLTNYPAFVISNFVVAFGLSCLEIAANPYIALCGPLEYAEVRLNLSQAVQAVGSVLSALLAGKVFFHNITAASSLVDVQWAYLGIAIFVFALAVAFYYIPLPEATDDELDELADRRSAVYRTKVGPWNVVYVTLALGVFSQWCYVGVQESLGVNVGSLVQLVKPDLKITTFDYGLVAHTVFAIGRFVSAFLNYILKPRWILLALYTGYLITFALQTTLDGDSAVVNQTLTFFFEAGIFSIIFAISMRGLGSHTKTGSAFMTTAISGGAIFPLLQWAAEKGQGLKLSYLVPAIGAGMGMIFAIYLNVVPAARLQVDPIHEKRHARRERKAQIRQDSIMSDVNGTSSQFGLMGILARRKKAQQANSATAEHVERQSELSSPTELSEKINISEVPPVKLKDPSGQVGALQPWPGGEAEGESSSSSQDLEDIITRHRPVWEDHDGEGDEDSDDGFYDYHAAIRKIGKK